MLRQQADALRVVDPAPDSIPGTRPSYDASPEAYRRLRRAVIEAGLLDRRYGYYLYRTLLSFAFVAIGNFFALWRRSSKNRPTPCISLVATMAFQ